LYLYKLTIYEANIDSGYSNLGINIIFVRLIFIQVFNKHSDKQLIEGIRKGDDNTLNYLYDNYFATVRNYIKKNSGTDEDAYDIFQDSLYILFKKIQENNFTLTTDLKGYVFSISRNQWHNLRRKNEKTSGIELDVADDLELEKLLDTPIEQIVQRSFLKLKDECQKVLTLHLEGKDYDEIAKIMKYKSATYARRKKYLCKESLVEIIKSDPEFSDYDAFASSGK
jgi:RNA polymerase sigma factor (sigma-70 family)